MLDPPSRARREPFVRGFTMRGFKFRLKELSGLTAGLIGLSLAVNSPARAATSITGDFNILNGSPSASGGMITFLLNNDGTIAANLLSTGLNIQSFSFNSNNFLVESGFNPTGPINVQLFLDMYGSQHSGFICSLSCGTGETWTIGQANQFTDVFQSISGSTSQYDFVLTDSGGNQWAANAHTGAVPEPATWATMLLGFGGIGFAMRRRRRGTVMQTA